LAAHLGRAMPAPMPAPAPVLAPVLAPVPLLPIPHIPPIPPKVMTLGHIMKHMNDLPAPDEKAFDATECPICLTDIGETNKSILRCGHIICMNCLMNQTIKAIAVQKLSDCKCCICRAPYM
jgi:hypothetical protein